MPKISEKFSNLTLRSFEASDLVASQVFMNNVAKESTHTLKYEGMPESNPTLLWEEYANHPVNLFIGAFHQNEVVANLRFFQRNPDHPWIKHIGAFGMAVRKDFWGKGLGTKMLQVMETHARTTEIKRIEAEVRVANERGIKLYQKNGFKIEGTREKSARINNEFVDSYYIAKLLI